MRAKVSGSGKVYLVGAGPGDPDLITVKGRRCLESAEALIYDRLVSPELLQWTPKATMKICVGKKGGHYAFPQAEINRLMVEQAILGKRVVRLKGGDPFVFGRGGEEAEYLTSAGIPFEIIPGVSSAFAVPAAAGIPVTHREMSSSVAVVTGYQSEDSASPVKWGPLARAVDTLVILMPLHRLKQVVSQLVMAGRSPDTPAALIESGTLGNQRQVIATLRDVEAAARRHAIGSPALLVVGEVVNLAGACALVPEGARAAS
jgi:uroporphyrin-III C-methyltransferase